MRFTSCIVDRVLRLSRGDRVEANRRVASALERFPAIAVADRPTLLRAIAVRDACNRFVFRAHNAFPRAALAVGRLVPIVGARALFAQVSLDRPIVFGLLHFGPTHFAIAVAARLFTGRTVYVFHAGGDTGAASAKFLGDIGTVPVLSGRAAFPTVQTAMLEHPTCVVILCYDHLGSPGRRDVRFLGTQIAFATGLARLARTTGAAVITGWWECDRRGPRVRIDRQLEIDSQLPDADAEDDLTDRSIAVLESRVRAAPYDWSEWINCYVDAAAATSSATRAGFA